MPVETGWRVGNSARQMAEWTPPAPIRTSPNTKVPSLNFDTEIAVSCLLNPNQQLAEVNVDALHDESVEDDADKDTADDCDGDEVAVARVWEGVADVSVGEDCVGEAEVLEDARAVLVDVEGCGDDEAVEDAVEGLDVMAGWLEEEGGDGAGVAPTAISSIPTTHHNNPQRPHSLVKRQLQHIVVTSTAKSRNNSKIVTNIIKDEPFVRIKAIPRERMCMYCKEARNKVQYLGRFDNDWATDAIISTHLTYKRNGMKRAVKKLRDSLLSNSNETTLSTDFTTVLGVDACDMSV
ncbi:hypothetical protein DFJ73DRAFT_770026 [Zopfochytrium polystomum]|nr:hypothetical protein DFJ73DRAFT_770026 [Zopfochytrium polystomum]